MTSTTIVFERVIGSLGASLAADTGEEVPYGAFVIEEELTDVMV